MCSACLISRSVPRSLRLSLWATCRCTYTEVGMFKGRGPSYLPQNTTLLILLTIGINFWMMVAEPILDDRRQCPEVIKGKTTTPDALPADLDLGD